MAGSLRAALGDSVAVSRPVRLADFRLRGLDLMVGQEDVRRAIASAGNCLETDILVGDFGRLPSGTRCVWVKCPVAAARALSERGRVTIGWSSAIVEYTRIHRTQCFRCWNYGHVRELCKHPEDRSSLCFKCGLAGHSAKVCNNKWRCTLCHENKWDSAHRMGSVVCRSAKEPRTNRFIRRN